MNRRERNEREAAEARAHFLQRLRMITGGADEPVQTTEAPKTKPARRRRQASRSS